MAVTIHPLPFGGGWEEALPERFTYPFCYQPHPLCVMAAQEVQAYLKTQSQWAAELKEGKMFGVLIVAPLRLPPLGGGHLGFLAAFSGTLDGKTCHPYFVPPVFDLMEPGCHFQEEQKRITAINGHISSLQAEIKESPLHQQMQKELDAYRMEMQRKKEERHRLRAELSAEELATMEPEMIRAAGTARP